MGLLQPQQNCHQPPQQLQHGYHAACTQQPCPAGRWRMLYPLANAGPSQRPLVPASVWGRKSSADKSPSPSSGAWRSKQARQPVQTSKRKQQQQPGRYKTTGGGGKLPSGGDSDDKGWQLFSGEQYNFKWDVPWGGGTTLGGMLLWFLSFIAVGIIAVPGLYRYAGVDIAALPMPSKATFTLACQAMETIVGLAVIRLVTAGSIKKRGEPESPSERLFNYSFRDPFKAPSGWAAWALGGVIIAPLVVGATAGLVALTGYEDGQGGKGTVDGVIGMIEVDLGTYLSLLAVTGVLAPLLEETVFRGFLLPSLCKSMPNWAAVGLSSLLFGAAHLSSRDLPVLVALGALLGVTYIRSRNLLTPIIIHGVWNSSVLSLLFALVASGVDVESALKDLR